MDSLDNLMSSDETMDFIKEEIEEKIDIDDIFCPLHHLQLMERSHKG